MIDTCKQFNTKEAENSKKPKVFLEFDPKTSKNPKFFLIS